MKIKLLFFTLFFTISGWGQTNITTQSFGATSTMTTGWSGTNSWAGSTSAASTGYSGSSGTGKALFGNTGTNGNVGQLTYNNSLSTVGYTSITVLWGARATSTFSQPVVFQWSIDGTIWNTVSYTQVTADLNWYLVNGGSRISLPSAAEGASNLQFRWEVTVNNSGTYSIDDFTVEGNCLTPPSAPPGLIGVSSSPSCGPATLSFASGYYWQTSPTGNDLSKPTSSDYILTSTGNMYVRAYSGGCWSSSNLDTGLITINPLLSITAQPVNKVITDGTNTTFVVAASAGASYQWQVDTGSGFANLANGGVYSNVTLATMTITAAPITMNGYLYRCVVTGTAPCTTVTSNSASLTVTQTPPNNPTNLKACYGNTTLDLSWTASTPTAVGNYLPDGYMVFVLSGATAPASAVAGNASAYSANSIYTAATVVTASLGKCVYKGTGTSASISALTNAANYSFTVVAYIGNTATVWSSGIISPGSWQITNIAADMPEVTGLTASVSNNQSTISWTNVASVISCNYEYLIVANQGVVAFTPTGDGTAYSANSIYSGANQVIYKGSSVNMTVTGLTNGLNYCFKIFVRRGTEWSTGVSICVTSNLVYCASSGNTSFNTSITNVSLNTINNSSAKPSGYSNYSAISTNLTAGLTYPLSVNVNTAGNFEVDGYAWIDFNQNGLFTDAGESFSLGSAINVVNGATLSSPLSITIPINAILGTTRMRITASYDTGINSCSTAFDGEVEDYTINIQPGCAYTVITSVTPNMAPVGTEVTINAASGLAGATAIFSGIAAIPVSSSATQLVVKVPPNAVTGDIVVTNAALCAGTPLPYSIIKEDKTSCEGVGGTFNDLIISEVFDTNAGNGLYLELYNPTNAAITVNAANPTYRIEIDNDKNGVLNGVNRTINITGTIPSGGVIVYNLGTNTLGESPCTSVATINLFGNGTNANDGVYLTKNNVIIDKLITINETGYSMLRNLTAVGPTTTYNAADWTITGVESCTDLGLFPANPKLAPIVTLHPTYIPSCKSTSMTIAGSEGYNGVGDTKELAYQWYVSAPAPALTDWTPLTDGGIYSGTSTLNLAISNISGVINYQYYCQIRENTGTCFSATNAIKISDAGAVTWNGSDWRDSSNALSLPSIGKLAIINGNYNTSINGSFDACSLVVNNGFTAIINSANYINIQYDLTVNGNLIVKNNGSLVQIDDNGVDTGIISMERTPTILRNTDYIYWSSPVTNFPVADISPSSGLIYKWVPTIARAYTSNFGGWATANSDIMLPGKGYIVRGLGTGLATFTNNAASGSGTINNGVINVGIQRSIYDGSDYTYTSGTATLTVNKDNDNYNLVGNPYPSAIDADTFLTFNTNIEGNVKIWSHGTAISASNGQSFYNAFVLTYTASDYVIWNKLGPSVGPQSFNGKIASGQGFFVTMNHSSASTSENITFNNSMRSKNYNNSNFFRSSSASKSNRIWMDIIDDTGNSIRTLIGYDKEATYKKDRMFDAKINLDTNLNIYSLIDSEPQIIQGRPMPFDHNDRVSLGIVIPPKSLNSTPSENTYKIGIAFVDGLFKNDNQNIYLEDKLLNIIHDLRIKPYVFESISGRFDNRFILRYTKAKTSIASDFKNSTNDVVVTTKDKEINIISEESIKKVTIYDIYGRAIFQKNNVNSNELSINEVILKRQALVIKIVLKNGQEISKKIIF